MPNYSKLTCYSDRSPHLGVLSEHIHHPVSAGIEENVPTNPTEIQSYTNSPSLLPDDRPSGLLDSVRCFDSILLLTGNKEKRDSALESRKDE